MAFGVGIRVVFVVAFLAGVPGVLFAGERITSGWLEQITLSELGVTVAAKMDTGADNSAMHATQIQYFQKEGQPWVHFVTLNQHELTMPVFKLTKIKTNNGGLQHRPMVLISLCFAGQSLKIPVSLVDRSHFKYSFLLGRSAMPQNLTIHPHEAFLTKPNCAG